MRTFRWEAREFLCVSGPLRLRFREFVCVPEKRPRGSSYASPKSGPAGVPMRGPIRLERPLREFLCVAQNKACWSTLIRFGFTLVAEGNSTKPLSATSNFASG